MRKVLLLAAAVLILPVVFFFSRQEPGRGHLLVHEQGASWIRFPEVFSPMARPTGVFTTLFDYCFILDKLPKKANFRLKSRSQAIVYVNHHLAGQKTTSGSDENTKKITDIAKYLRLGPNRIILAVKNQNSHPVMIAVCSALNIATGRDWRASKDGVNWIPAVSVDRTIIPQVTQDFDNIIKNSYLLSGGLVLFVFAMTVLWIKLPGRYRLVLDRIRPFCTPQNLRWLLLFLWGVLLINNIGKIPLLVGMDSEHHYDYIDYLVHNRALPYASDGVQMFQPPLFYVLSAAFKAALVLFFDEETANLLLRVIPLLCGLGMIEVCYRCLVLVYPDNSKLQGLGLIFGSLMPMNLYISQVVGNEPLAGLLTGFTVYLTLRMSLSHLPRKRRDYIYLGLVFGLGGLTKPTPLLLLPVLTIAIWDHCRCDKIALAETLRLFLTRMTIFLSTAFTVCGWYYLRNYYELGSFFIGGWDPTGFNQWWQDPAYRTIRQLAAFGSAWLHPIYASAYGFWDALYATIWTDGNLSGITNFHDRPPWNYSVMFSCGLLSIFPTIMGLYGLAMTFTSTSEKLQPGQVLSILGLFSFLAAMLWLYLLLPVYSTAKSTYTLGLLPCYAIVIAAGLRPFMTSRLLQPGIIGLSVIWAISAYGGFFVVSCP